MRFDLFTLFPEICAAYLQESILKRAQAAGLVSVHLHNIRDYATDRHHTTDDLPYGGGGGMVMKPEPIFEAVESVLKIRHPPSAIRHPNLQPLTSSPPSPLSSSPLRAVLLHRPWRRN